MPRARTKLLYQNFDGISISFNCEINPNILEVLEMAKNKAQETDCKNGYVVLLGEGDRESRKQVKVGRTGNKGGYAYIVRTEVGEFRVKNVTKQGDNLFFQALSTEMVKMGTLEKLFEVMANEYAPLFCNEIYSESINRVDYAVDFYQKGFKLDHEKFYAVNSKVKTKFDVMTFEEMEKAQMGEPIFKNGHCMTVTSGEPPFRQMCFYNKRAEVIENKKQYFYEIWQEQMPELDKDNRDHIVWRCEMRMFKRYLSEKLGIYSIRDFLEHGVNAFVELFSSFKYLKKKKKNIKKGEKVPVMKIWEWLRDRFKLIFKHKWTGEVVRRVKNIIKDEKVRELQVQGFGCLLSSLAINLQDIDGTTEQLETKVNEAFKVYCRKNHEKIADVLLRAGRRYQFKGDLSRMAVLDANLAEMMEGAC